MISIDDYPSKLGLPPPIERLLRPLLTLRADQLTAGAESQFGRLARFLIVESSDLSSAIDAALGFSVLQNFVDAARSGDVDFEPSWEWIEDHGGFFELAFILTDDGFAHLVFVPDQEGVDPDLLDLCRRYGRNAAS